MLEHVLRGLKEVAVITDRETGSRAFFAVTLDSAERRPEFTLTHSADPDYAVSIQGEWVRLTIGCRVCRARAAYLKRKWFNSDLPAFILDARYDDFEIRFEVITVHPNPELATRARDTPAAPPRGEASLAGP